LIKNKKEKVMVTWKKGIVDTMRWEKLWSEKIIRKAKWKGKEMEKWKEVKKVVRGNERGEIEIEYENAREKKKWTEEVEKQRKENWKKIKEVSEEALWKMLKGCKGIKKKVM
jgi:hypothetical protein